MKRLTCNLKILAGAKLQEAPAKKEMFGKWYSHIIKIDKDYTAELLIDEESLKVLVSQPTHAVNILERPVLYPLSLLLCELKFGRPRKDQKFLDDCISRLD